MSVEDGKILEALHTVAQSDVEGLMEARRHYGESWKAEGGFSAWFNVKRKIDRLVKLCSRPVEVFGASDFVRERYNIFSHIEADLIEGGEGVLDTIRDLRRYLTLVEAEMLLQDKKLPLQRDNAAVQKRRQEAFQAKPNGQECPFGFDPALDVPFKPAMDGAVVSSPRTGE